MFTRAAFLLTAIAVFSQGDGFRFPAQLKDVDGRKVAMDSLARTRKLIVVTVKASWCPICHEQLRRLRNRLSEAEACGISFVVLGPGPAEELASMRGKSKAPFFFVEDKQMRFSSALGLQLSEGQIEPALIGIT